MYDFFRFSDSRRARIAPLLPTDIHGPKKTLCNRSVRRAGRGGIREGIFSAPAGAEDTPDRLFIDKLPHQGSSLRRRWKRGPWPPCPPCPHGIGRTKGGRNTGLHAVRDHKGRPVFLSIASCSRRPETCMIARSHSAASRPCRHPPNVSPAKAVTAGNCANGLKSAGPGPSSRRERTARADITTPRGQPQRTALFLSCATAHPPHWHVVLRIELNAVYRSLPPVAFST